MPYCSFFRGHIYFYGLELLNLNPNSLLYISIYIHLCDAFLGIRPYFDPFRSLFIVRPLPSPTHRNAIGGVGLQQRNTSVYFQIPLPCANLDWRALWYLCDNPRPCLPDFYANIAPVRPEWNPSNLPKELAKDEQVKFLLSAIEDLKKAAVSEETIVWSFITRRVQPIKRQTKPGWTFLAGNITKEVPDPVRADKVTAQVEKILSRVSAKVAGRNNKAYNGQSFCPSISISL